nr:hypothetical protein CFP56_75733 [Quercus suber]
MTALEITHSRGADEIEGLVAQLAPHLADLTEHTLTHRARLVKPLLSFDSQALALSFLPSATEGGDPEAYTYHHLRRDLHTKAQAAGVHVASRYVIPSAHLTLGRFIVKTDLETETGEVDRDKVRRLVQTIEGINEWLGRKYWAERADGKHGGDWLVGEEKGLECRQGTLWYGDGGETVMSVPQGNRIGARSEVVRLSSSISKFTRLEYMCEETITVWNSAVPVQWQAEPEEKRKKVERGSGSSVQKRSRMMPVEYQRRSLGACDWRHERRGRHWVVGIPHRCKLRGCAVLVSSVAREVRAGSCADAVMFGRSTTPVGGILWSYSTLLCSAEFTAAGALGGSGAR